MSTKEIGLPVFGVLVLALWVYLSVTSLSMRRFCSMSYRIRTLYSEIAGKDAVI